MTKTLDYEKEHGLLWKEINKMMSENDASTIANYIKENNSEYWA